MPSNLMGIDATVCAGHLPQPFTAVTLPPAQPLPPFPQFAFVTYAAPEAAVAALQAVDGTLCPELNPSGLIAAEYRRGLGARLSCDGGPAGPALTFHPSAAGPAHQGFPGTPPPPPYPPGAAVVYAPAPAPGLNQGLAAWGGGAVAWAGAWPAGWPSPRPS